MQHIFDAFRAIGYGKIAGGGHHADDIAIWDYACCTKTLQPKDACSDENDPHAFTPYSLS